MRKCENSKWQVECSRNEIWSLSVIAASEIDEKYDFGTKTCEDILSQADVLSYDKFEVVYIDTQNNHNNKQTIQSKFFCSIYKYFDLAKLCKYRLKGMK